MSTVRCVVVECGCRCRYQVKSRRQAAKKRSLSMEVKKPERPGSFQVGGEGRGEAAGAPPWVGGAGRVGGVVSGASGEGAGETSGGGGQPWPLPAEVQKGGLRGVSRALAG